MEDANWYYLDGGQPVGPVPLDVLKQLAALGRITAWDRVWQDGMPDWVQAGSVSELTFSAPAAQATDSPSSGFQQLAARKRAEKAAKASWMIPLIVLGVGSCLNASTAGREIDRGGAIAAVLGSLLLYVSGLALGIRALRQVRTFGPERIRGPALAGITLCSVVILLNFAMVGYFLWLAE